MTSIEKNVNAHYRKNFGHDKKVNVFFVYLPAGQAYVGGQQSTASSVMLPVPDNISLEDRHKFMREFCDIWANIVNCKRDEIILNAPNYRDAVYYLKSMSGRFRPSMRLLIQLRLLLRFKLNRMRTGHNMTSVNISGK
jgi:hypothetical protein